MASTRTRDRAYQSVDHAFEPNAALDLIMKILPITGLSGKEGKVAEFVTKQLRDAGVPATAIRHDDANKRSPLGGDLGNLIVTLPGTIPGPRRLLMAHLDTVPLCAGTRPVRRGEYVRSGNPATGLGADNRSGVSAILSAVRTVLKKRLPHPPLTLFFPVQEEVGLYGARFADLKLLGQPKLCFNWDSNEPNSVTIGATGAYRMTVDIAGIASHAGVHPECGVSAAAIAGLAIAELQQKRWHGLIKRGKKSGTSNIGVVQGGNATNVVMPALMLRVEARSHDAKFRTQIKDAIVGAFERAAKRVKNTAGAHGTVRVQADLHYESFRISERAPAVLEARRVITELGMKPQFNVTNGGLDANWLSSRGLPTVTLGAGQQNVHTVDERLYIPSFLTGCKVALKLATAS